MNSYLAVTLDSALSKENVREVCQELLPEFTWKFGESEYEGTYVSGRRKDVGNIQCWTDDPPVAFTVALLATVPDQERREIMDRAKKVVAPRLGRVLKVEER